MSTPDISPDPSATPYHERLDISIDADVATVRRAGKIASNQYHPDNGSESASHESFIRLKKARETLQDTESRREYMQFCDLLGEIEGTERYEEWKHKGSPASPRQFVDSYESDSEDTSDDSSGDSMERDESHDYGNDSPVFYPDIVEGLREYIDSPTIEWANYDAADVRLNHWSVEDHARLYINSFVSEEFDFYIDLDTGEVRNDNGVTPDVKIEAADNERSIFITFEARTVKIAPAGGSDSPDTEDRDRQQDTSSSGEDEYRHRRQFLDDDPASAYYDDSDGQTKNQDEQQTEMLEEMQGESPENISDDAVSGFKKDSFKQERINDLTGGAEDAQDSGGTLQSLRNMAAVASTSVIHPVLAINTPSSWGLRLLLGVAWLGLIDGVLGAASLGAVLILGAVIPFPRFGPWVSSFAFIVGMFNEYTQLARIQLAAVVVLSVAYYILVRGTMYDPYASDSSG